MEPSPTFYVRGRCVCGRRYRIRNAQAGVLVKCPACGRAIPVSDADIRAALAGARLIPVQQEDVEPKEAILIDAGELHLAPEGSRPGLTGGAAPDHEDAAVIKGLGLRPLDSRAVAPPAEGERPAAAPPEDATRPASFVADLVASFYFAGKPSNAGHVLATAAACSVVLWLGMLLPGLARLAGLILAGLVLLYVVQFYWSILAQTAGGEDDLPWFAADWDLWDDAFKPLLWLIAISGLCTLPAAGLYWYLPASYAWKSRVVWAGLIGGWFFWPVAVMSVALGNTLLFLRPDWLLRCVVGIGPAYVLAWLGAMLVVAGWVVFYRVYGQLAALPFIGAAVSLYLGYVLFRILGLLYRHFHSRFPWGF